MRAPSQVKFHPDRRDVLASGSTDGLVCLFDISQPIEDDALFGTLNSESSVVSNCWVYPTKHSAPCLACFFVCSSVHRRLQTWFLGSLCFLSTFGFWKKKKNYFFIYLFVVFFMFHTHLLPVCSAPSCGWNNSPHNATAGKHFSFCEKNIWHVQFQAEIGWCGDHLQNIFCTTHIDTLHVWNATEVCVRPLTLKWPGQAVLPL